MRRCKQNWDRRSKFTDFSSGGADSFSKSSYYYQNASLKREDKRNDILKKITKLFYENKGCYGYRRIYGLLKREGIHLLEKIVRRILQEENLMVKRKRHRKYSSYQGEIPPAVPNVLRWDLHADQSNRKCLTDIIEFAIPAGKVYLSSILDCFDGMHPCWTISRSPDANLINSMLDQAISRLREEERPLIHSDRGCHYRWAGLD